MYRRRFAPDFRYLIFVRSRGKSMGWVSSCGCSTDIRARFPLQPTSKAGPAKSRLQSNLQNLKMNNHNTMMKQELQPEDWAEQLEELSTPLMEWRGCQVPEGSASRLAALVLGKGFKAVSTVVYDSQGIRGVC